MRLITGRPPRGGESTNRGGREGGGGDQGWILGEHNTSISSLKTPERGNTSQKNLSLIEKRPNLGQIYLVLSPGGGTAVSPVTAVAVYDGGDLSQSSSTNIILPRIFHQNSVQPSHCFRATVV